MTHLPCGNTGCPQYAKGQTMNCKMPILPLQKQCHEYSPQYDPKMFGDEGVMDMFNTLFGTTKPK